MTSHQGEPELGGVVSLWTCGSEPGKEKLPLLAWAAFPPNARLDPPLQTLVSSPVFAGLSVSVARLTRGQVTLGWAPWGVEQHLWLLTRRQQHPSRDNHRCPSVTQCSLGAKSPRVRIPMPDFLGFGNCMGRACGRSLPRAVFWLGQLLKPQCGRSVAKMSLSFIPCVLTVCAVTLQRFPSGSDICFLGP